MEWSRDLYHYEEIPPEGNWESIRRGLDHAKPSFDEGLFQYQATPPPTVWERIRKDLDGSVPAKLIWYQRPVTIAAAASIAGLVFLAWFYFRDGVNMPAPSIATSIYQPEPKTPASRPTRPAGDPIEENKTNFTARDAQATPSTAFAENNDMPLHYGRSALNQLAMLDIPHIVRKQIDLPYKLNKDKPKEMMESLQFSDGNYFHIRMPDGNVKRVSYKLLNKIPALREDEEDPTMRDWTQKMQNAAFIPTGNNFFDIGEMVKILSEKK